MKLGWVDFSKEDRDRTLDVINLLQEEGAVDELGFGIVRDGFANRFFPGTSTVQTRAKYFLIVPYALKDIALSWSGTNVAEAMRKLDEIERQCGRKLYYGSDTNGVIGIRVLPYRWVSRTPSNIYWSGIRTYSIFKNQNLSIPEFFRLCSISNIEKRSNKRLGNRSDDPDDDQDDKDAGETTSIQLLNIPCYRKNWQEELTIGLTQEEAEFLSNQIKKSVPDSLMAFVLNNNIDLNKYQNFLEFSEDNKSKMSEEMRRLVDLANAFNELVYLARVRYNYLLSEGKNDVAAAEWERLSETMTKDISVDLEQTFSMLNISVLNIHNKSTFIFLRQLQNLVKNGNVVEIDRLLKQREINLKKPNRAKLNHIGEYDPDAWVGGAYLDYRFREARRIINDIYRGAENA